MAAPCKRTSWRAVNSRTGLCGGKHTASSLLEHFLLTNHLLLDTFCPQKRNYRVILQYWQRSVQTPLPGIMFLWDPLIQTVTEKVHLQEISKVTDKNCGQGWKLTLSKRQMWVDFAFGGQMLEGYLPHWWVNLFGTISPYNIFLAVANSGSALFFVVCRT